MMPKYLFIFIFASLLSGICYAQKSGETNIPVFFEKVYLHTDRDVYAPGEDIWYKAYLVNAQTNIPLDYSHNLYVELINPLSKIIYRKMLRLDKGLSYGDFKLADTLGSGNYRIRAYTNWMRNFGDNFIFEKSITIISAPGKLNISQRNANKKISPVLTPQAKAAINDTLPTVRFFPEGGSMINDVNSVVAVKSQDAAGYGVAASGDIIDNAGKVLTHFICDSLGFGVFSILPDITQHYQALVTMNGLRSRYIIPGTVSDGFNMFVIEYEKSITVNINCNEATLNKNQGNSIYLVAQHSGKTYIRKTEIISGKNTVIKIPIADLPEGITCITVKDALANPVCERLIYVYHPNAVLLTAITNQADYNAKEKVTVHIKLSQSGKSNLSLSAVDAAIPVQSGNIVSYLNLQSEIKGNIEKPNRYFDTTNVNRFKQLDLLLLTQGWRNFVWQKIADTVLDYNREPEQGLTITGKVRKVWSKNALSGISVTMRAPNAEGQKLFWTTTDPEGRFVISNPIFYGYQLLAFTSRKSDKINDEGSSKGNSGGWIKIDSLIQDTLPVKTHKQLSDPLMANREALSFFEKYKRDLHLPESQNLKEVTIKAITNYVPPEVHLIILADQKEYINLAQYLMYMINGASIKDMPCRWCTTPNDPLVPPPMGMGLWQGIRRINVTGTYADNSKIDYCYVCQDQYLNLKMNDVLKVTINKRDNVSTVGSVSIIMRPGALETKDSFDNAVADMVGYAKARVFYTPRPGEMNDKPDPRTNTIYWEPNITTDDNGEAIVSFYNTDLKSNVRLIIEGVSNHGDLLTTSINYQVK